MVFLSNGNFQCFIEYPPNRDNVIGIVTYWSLSLITLQLWLSKIQRVIGGTPSGLPAMFTNIWPATWVIPKIVIKMIRKIMSCLSVQMQTWKWKGRMQSLSRCIMPSKRVTNERYHFSWKTVSLSVWAILWPPTCFLLICNADRCSFVVAIDKRRTCEQVCDYFCIFGLQPVRKANRYVRSLQRMSLATGRKCLHTHGPPDISTINCTLCLWKVQ